MSQFITELSCHLKDDDCVWVLDKPLGYYSSLLKHLVTVPTGFETDLASVPRLPFIYTLWGGKAHREGVIHDYLYRSNSVPLVPRATADSVFKEAMGLRGKPWYVRWPMFWGVRLGGFGSYHKRLVGDKFKDEPAECVNP